MITSKSVTITGFISVIIMAISFALVIFKFVPEEWTIPLFVVALLAFASRVVIRILFKRQQERFQSEELRTPTDQNE